MVTIMDNTHTGTRTPMRTDHDTDGHDLRHHGDAEVRDDGAKLVDLAVNVRADTPCGLAA